MKSEIERWHAMKTFWRLCASAVIAAILAPLGHVSVASALEYSVTTLEPLPGDTTSFVAMEGVNNRGQVVGSSGVSPSVPVIWNGTTPTALGTFSGSSDSFGTSINNRGQIVGYSYFFNGNTEAALATSWIGTTPTALGSLGGNVSGASAINNSGQIAGLSQLPNGDFRAVIWNRTTTPTNLGTLGGNSSAAYGINNRGQVVGFAALADGTNRAVIWTGTTPTVLGMLPGATSAGASSINNRGQVVGNSTFCQAPSPPTCSGPFRATIWNGTTPTDLGMLPGAFLSFATAINNAGQVVGASDLDLNPYAHFTPLFGMGPHLSISTAYLTKAVSDGPLRTLQA